jgi:hypothetical protein
MRLRLAVATALALVGCVSGASSAFASGYQPQFDPQAANVPYLAWRGEAVRLVTCDTATAPWSTDTSVTYTATWSIVDWSDTGAQPSVSSPSQVVTQGPNALYKNAHCARIDYTSQRAGLALVHVDISDGTHTVGSHDFLVGWLKLSKVTLDDGSGGTDVYDAPGWGSHNWLRAHVYGELPLSGFSDLYCPGQGCIPGLPASIQLPSEDKANQPAGAGDPTTWWDDLAMRLAHTTSTDPFYSGSNAWRMWDIHDDMTPTVGNVDADAAISPQSGYSGPCVTTNVDLAPIPDTSIDAVDNCQGGLPEEGPYSRIWPSLTGGLPIGPWDPLRWDETFLGDGKLNSGDVPMPSARLKFLINPNTDPQTDIGGVGTLQALTKDTVYVRDPNAGADAPHNFYAPFYRAYIPATLAELDGRYGLASGTDWQPGGNYPTTYNCATAKTNGVDCSYPYWEKDATLSSVVGGATRCARDFQNGSPEWRNTPTGDQGIAVYSDEHGEAMVSYVPGWDFYYDAIIAANPGIITSGNGCDLGDVYPLGKADVSAIAQYPGAAVPLDIDKTSNTLHEYVDNYYTRSVTCAAKGSTGSDLLSQVCTATSVDIDNTAIQGANVCFTVTGVVAGSVKPFPAGTASTTDAQSRLCETTDWSGEASIEIVGSCTPAAAPVKVDFLDDKIQRATSADLSYCPPPPSTTTTTTTATTTTPPPHTTTTTPRTTTTSAPPATTSSTPPATTSTTTTTTPTTTTKQPTTTTVALVKIQRVRTGSRYVNVRVTGTAKTVKIDIRLIKANRKTLRHVLRVIPTNKLVRVPKLKLDKIVWTVKVTLAG